MHRSIHATLEKRSFSAFEALLQQQLVFLHSYPDDHYGICMILHLNHDDHVHLLFHLLNRLDWMWHIMVYTLFNHYLLQFLCYIGPPSLHPQDYFEPLTIAQAVCQHRLQWSSTYSFHIAWQGGHQILHHQFSFTYHFLPLSHQYLLGFSTSKDDANYFDFSDHSPNQVPISS